MDAPRRLDVSELVERSRLGRFQLEAFAVLGACLVMDGFDVQAMGYVAPAVIREWGIPNADMGPVFGAGLAGLFLGSIAFSMLADRIGRRPVLIGATLWFASLTVLGAYAASVPQLLAARFLAGLGLGAIMPNATALVGEYTPAPRRVATMMIVTNGFMIGAVLGGLVSAWLIPAHGWRSVFLVGGVAPLAVAGAMCVWLPESLQLLAVSGKSQDRIARWARRLEAQERDGAGGGSGGSGSGGGGAARVLYVSSEQRRGGFPLADLFRAGRGAGTALLWFVSFLNVLNAYFVASWLPTVLRDGGHSTSLAVLVGTVVQVGGAVGTFVLGGLARRIGITPLLVASFGAAAVCLATIGRPGLALPALLPVAFVLGWGIFAGPPGLNAIAATYYPTDLRSTGIGASLGVGRVGAIFGPLVASALMLRHWSHEELFRAAALPALVSALAVLVMRRAMRPRGTPRSATPTCRRPPRAAGAS